ncbi:MAG TPA: DMT family transporter [Vicinamibacterales bacterium]|nr:DMT family transporter [Vicinamibacterales bacterium]
MRIAVLTSLTMVAFASNSLLTRGALGRGLIDAPSFTLIRLITGAAMLALLLRLRTADTSGDPSSASHGSWNSGFWLAGYAVAFTIAYTMIGAGVGALLLFGAVQATMIIAGLTSGERPRVTDWIGLALAMTGLSWLTLYGANRPDGLGAFLMVLAGVCWGGYSLAGRRSRDPMASTAGNFWRAALLSFAALVYAAARGHLTPAGMVLATVSGAVASGVGYTLWYSVLPELGAWRAALVQLTVPVITGLGAALVLGESITTRLIVAALLVGGGVGLSLSRK